MNEQQEVANRSGTDPQQPGQGSEARTAARESAGQAEWTLVPDVDIYEDSDGIFVKADMPGVSKDRLDIQVNQDTLTIEGEARIDMPEDMEAQYADIRSTRYRRSFVLSTELDTDRIDANLRNGVLAIQIPKRAEAKPRKIEVKAG